MHHVIRKSLRSGIKIISVTFCFIFVGLLATAFTLAFAAGFVITTATVSVYALAAVMCQAVRTIIAGERPCDHESPVSASRENNQGSRVVGFTFVARHPERTGLHSERMRQLSRRHEHN